MILTKVHAAEHLLDAAIEALLDRNDPVTAIVLAGSAEDVFQGLLKLQRREHEAARAQLLPHLRAFIAREDPSATPLADNTVFNMMRSTFTWLRHADHEREPLEIDRDLHTEALLVLYRAAENGYSVTETAPPRMMELVHWERTRKAERA